MFLKKWGKKRNVEARKRGPREGGRGAQGGDPHPAQENGNAEEKTGRTTQAKKKERTDRAGVAGRKKGRWSLTSKEEGALGPEIGWGGALRIAWYQSLGENSFGNQKKKIRRERRGKEERGDRVGGVGKKSEVDSHHAKERSANFSEK